MLFSVHYRHMTGAVYILKAHPTFLEKMKNIHTHARTHIHKEAPGDHQRGCYQIWTECNRGFSKEFFSGLVQSQSGGTLLWLEKHWSHAWRVWFRYISIGCHHSKGWWNLFSFFFAPPPTWTLSAPSEYIEHKNLNDLRCHPLWMGGIG